MRLGKTHQLAQVVPSAASDMLATRNFPLVQALAKLEAVFSQVCHISLYTVVVYLTPVGI